MNGLQLYFRLVGFSVRAQLAYRTSFLLQVFGQFLATFVEFLALWALLDRFGNIQGWRLAEVCFFYGTVHLTFAVADALSRGFDQFGTLVRSGDFDRLLLRPRSTVLQLLGHELTLRRIGRFSQALLVLGFGFTQLPELATAANFLLLFWTVAAGICLFLGILMLQATICFWTVESIEMMNVLTYGGVTSAQYPLTIYHEWLQKFFFFIVPLGCVSFLPLIGVLGREGEFGFSPWQIWLAPLAGPAFLLVALQVWRLGVRRYCSTGN
jgi:ABC-2 type transport system permease protein